ncbi:hypothetical protein GCM10023235_51440 [Kitasatospora terrestris]|uniref:Uncharacterized protein n=1 Tax=Kitasatospora terrestris TaxID=258051 RepID=A0ABP9E2M3_9ACTN
MDSGSFTVHRSGRERLKKLRMDCWGSRRSPSLGSGTISPLAIQGANRPTTVSSHCQGWTGSSR